MSWAEDFFDEGYLQLYGRFAESRTRAELAAIERYCPLRPGDRLLDLACGTGRHAVPLAAQGYRVTGLEFSGLYLERARERAARRGVELELVQADMRDLPFEGCFEGVICMFNSFGYFGAQDNRRVLAGIHRALIPQGWLLLDVMDHDHIVRNQHEGRTVHGPGFVLHETSRVEDGVNLVTQRVQRPGQPTQTRRAELTLYRPPELAALLQECGFAPRGQWGDLEGGRPAQSASTRLLTLAERV